MQWLVENAEQYIRLMKIGILTFHRAENFGAVLQCFALQHYLESLGAEVLIVDYRCQSIERAYEIWNPRILLERFNIYYTMTSYLSRFKNFQDRRRRKRLFRDFRNIYLHQSSPYDAILAPLNVDALIVGSDQVWNTVITKGYDPIYFLDFPVLSGTRRYSYAASSELVSYNQMQKDKSRIASALSTFDAISVREKQLAERLQPMLKFPIDTVCDPTFLLDAASYKQLAKKPDLQGYVLVYHMMETSEGVRLAEKLAVKENRTIVEIHANYGNHKDRCRHKYDLGPLEMLGYILNADTVITNSFHGLAFSLLFGKKVWVVCENGYNARLEGLLKTADIKGCLISSADEAEGRNIDYSSALSHMSTYIEHSRNFLKDIVRR